MILTIKYYSDSNVNVHGSICSRLLDVAAIVTLESAVESVVESLDSGSMRKDQNPTYKEAISLGAVIVVKNTASTTARSSNSNSNSNSRNHRRL